MTNEEQKIRAKVTGVTVNLIYPDGTPGTITIDTKTTKALFWDDQTVLNILAPYYVKNNPEMTKEVLINLFGTIGKKVAGNKDKVKVDKKVIEKLWTESDEAGNSLPMLAKSIFCIPAPGGGA